MAVPKLNVVNLYRQFDEMVNAVSTRNVDCKAGCSYCCYIRVVAHAHEVFHVVDHVINNFSTEKVKALITKAEDNLRRIEGMTPQEHIATNIACPLLDVDTGKCGVYEARPSRCRAYHSLDVSVCHAAHIDTHYSAPHPYDYNILLNSDNYHTNVAQSLMQNQSDSYLYEFNGALVEAFKKPDSRTRWQKGKRAFSAKHISEL